MRILVSGSEIANNIHAIKHALLNRWQHVDSCCFTLNSYYKNNHYDYLASSFSSIKIARIRQLLNLLSRIILFIRVAFKYDIYIYIWRDTFLPFKLDFLILRLLGKKVVVFHCGDDVRYRPIQSGIDRNHCNVHYFSPTDHTQISIYETTGSNFLRSFSAQLLTEKWGATIVSMRSHATFQNAPAYFFRFPQQKMLSAQKNASSRPLIIHAPTDRVGKGTKYVLEAIDNLRSAGLSFDFELIENKPNSYLLEQLKKADILVDQPGPWFGKLGAEALASGCAIISGNKPQYYGIPNTSPVVQFEPDAKDLEQKLLKLVQDSFYRDEIMKKSYLYWETVYSEQSFNNYMADIFNGGGNEFIFFPFKNQKELLIKYAKTPLQRLAIRAFYRQMDSEC